MKKSHLILMLRITLGATFAFFGLNGFVPMIEEPDMSFKARLLMEAFSMSGYLLTLIKGSELAIGLLILSGKFRALALIMLTPLLLNILLFHLFLAPETLVVPIVLSIILGILAWDERKVLRPLLKP